MPEITMSQLTDAQRRAVLDYERTAAEVAQLEAELETARDRLASQRHVMLNALVSRP